MESFVRFNRKDLEDLDIDILKKLMFIQVESEKYEGAAIIRDEIEKKKRKFLDQDQGDTEETQ